MATFARKSMVGRLSLRAEHEITHVQRKPRRVLHLPLPSVVLAVGYIIGWSLLGVVRLRVNDIEQFYLPAIRLALAGHPFAVYSFGQRTGYPLANGPLSLVPLGAIVALVDRLGWQHHVVLTRLLIVAVFSIFPLLLAREAVRAVDAQLATPLRGVRRFLVYEALLCSIQLWQSMLYYGHIEQPMMLWLVLLAVRALANERPAWTGMLLGLALLTRTSAVVVVIPLAVLLLCRRGWRPFAQCMGMLAGTVIVGLLPFIVAAPRDVAYSLLISHGTFSVSANNFWLLVEQTPLIGLAEHEANLVVLGVVLLVSALRAIKLPLARIGARDTYLLLAVCSLCAPVFVNRLWPYYFLEPVMFVMLWWLMGMGALSDARRRRAWWLLSCLPLGELCAAQLIQWALALSSASATVDGQLMIPLANMAACGLMLTVLGVLLVYLFRSSQPAARYEPVTLQIEGV